MAEEEAEDDFHEAQSQLQDETDKLHQRIQTVEAAMLDIFSTVSSLKNAYIELQKAHSPYDPEKLRLADKAVILELRKLSELKHNFRTGRHPTTLISSRNVQELQRSLGQKRNLIETYRTQMEIGQRELTEKKEQIQKLKEALKNMTDRKEKLEKRITQNEQNGGSKEAANVGIYLEMSVTSQIFEMTAQAAREHAFGFAKLLIGLMRKSDWDLEAAANSIQPGVIYTRPVHKMLAFESYVCHRMFNGFENENFYLSGSLTSILDPEKHRHDCFLQFQDMRSIDPVELLSVTPDCLFGRFCHKKYLQIVHERMEESLFGNMEQRNEILKGVHPRSDFYKSFLQLAKCVRREREYDKDFMESIVEMNGGDEDGGDGEGDGDGDDEEEEELNVKPKVGFTVMPGFRLQKSIVKCLVYLILT